MNKCPLITSININQINQNGPNGTATKYIPSFIARQRLSKHVHVAMNTHNSRTIVGPMCLGISVYPSIVAR
jgi:hypothetical protein